jgi:hypothetical protein
MAQGWLAGRLALADVPPGYPRAHDDWGRVWTLGLRDGTTLRGDPCRTPPCDQLRRAGIETWRPTVGARARSPVATSSRARAPGTSPSRRARPLLMLPGVALWGLGFLDVLFTALAGALIPVVLVRLLERVRGPGAPARAPVGRGRVDGGQPGLLRRRTRQRVVHRAGARQPRAVSVHRGRLGLRRPRRAGLWLGLAVACRVSIAPCAVIFADARRGRPRPGAGGANRVGLVGRFGGCARGSQ